ncbi:MAG: hypothetical protein JKY65_11550 [Planctomycetes bacterium]|nr:hypothetical protein [Planctomycetota bacterium]
MSDQHLRELEATWRASGSVEDEAAYLLERVRAGELTQERLELAAYCGHKGARVEELKSAPQEHGSRRWYLFLSWRGQEACVRASLAALALLREPTVSHPQLVPALARSRRWVLGPGGRLAVQQEALDAVAIEGDKLGWVLAAHADRCLTKPMRWGDSAATVADAVQGACRDLVVHERVREEVVMWALGFSDPVRERVEARQREAAGG